MEEISQHVRFGPDKCLDGMVSLNKENGLEDVIIFLHGFLADYKGEENEGRAKIYCEKAAEYGFVGLTFSFSGHGESSGKRGYISKEQLVEDISYAVNFAKRSLFKDIIGENIDIKTISLCGSSTGATGALYYALENPERISSLVLTSPFTSLEHVNISEKQREALEECYQYYKKMGVEMYLPFDRTDNPEEKKQFPITAYYGLKHLNGLKIARKIDVPTLVLCGNVDNWVSPKSIKELYENIASKTKELKEYNDVHSLKHHKHEVIEDVFNWFKKIIKKKKIKLKEQL